MKIITLKFTEEGKEALNYERYHHSDPRVQGKMEALWLKNQDESHQRIAQLTGVTAKVITKYVKQYKAGGIAKLKEINMDRPESERKGQQQTIEHYFQEHPLLV